jgi:hypothetical protein
MDVNAGQLSASKLFSLALLLSTPVRLAPA